MQLNKTFILEKVYKNKMLNDAIKNIVEYKYIDDFRSHFILQIANTKEQKLIDLYQKGQLDWFCLRVITNQWKSVNSTFWKLYRNNGFFHSNFIRYEEEYKQDYLSLDTELWQRPQQEKQLEPDITPEQIAVKVKKFLLEQYTDFYVNQYHKTLFELYYYDKKNLRQISEETDITICSISRSIRKTKKYIKNKLKDELY